MAKTEIKDLGSSVCEGPASDEHFVPALGNGTAVPGDACYRDPATGKLLGSDVGAAEFFEGILMESPITGTETAIVDGVPCRLVVPKSNHRYRVRCNDMGANKETGDGIVFSSTVYKFDIGTTLILAFCGRLNLPYVDNDTVCEIIWK